MGFNERVDAFNEQRRKQEYERWPRKDWQYDVANGDTKLGYEEWVAHNVESEQPTEDLSAAAMSLWKVKFQLVDHTGKDVAWDEYAFDTADNATRANEAIADLLDTFGSAVRS